MIGCPRPDPILRLGSARDRQDLPLHHPLRAFADVLEVHAHLLRGLVGIMGGPATPGVGWASGVERCMMLLEKDPPARRPIALVPVGAAAERECLILANALRQRGLYAELGYSGNVGKRMKRANKLNARVAVILGDDELAKRVATVRDLDSGEQREIAMEALAQQLEAY